MKLSIITINYNNLEGLRRTFESVICQTWTDYEWLVIDGGSTDGSKEFIEANQKAFSYWCSEPDKGVYNAMNKGIAKAKGEFLNFMNSGDSFYDADTLKNVFSETHEVDIVYGNILRTYEKQKKNKIYSFGPIVDIYSLCQCNIPHQAMFIRLEFHRKHLYDENFGIMADWKNWCMAALGGCTFKYIPIVVARYPMDGLSSNQELFLRDYNRIRSEIIPKAVMLTVEELESFRKTKAAVRAKRIVRSGGVKAMFAKGILKILDI